VNCLPKALTFALPPQRRLGAKLGWGKWFRVSGSVETGLRPVLAGPFGFAQARLRPATTQNKTFLVLLGILLLALPCAAQLEVGDTAMSLSGDIGVNYNGSMNQGASAHTMGLSGDANLQGYYYNPNFLSFNVRPYYDRAQTNSVFGALTNTSGVNAGVNLFSGSHFPGSFSYGKVDNSSGEFGVPGSGVGLATNGNSQSFGVSWSELLPDWPTLMANYAITSSSASIYGTQQESSQTDHDLMLMSTYKLAGFRISGGYTHRNIDGTFSELLEGVAAPVQSDTATNNYEVNASHSFPMQGSYSVSFSRTSYDYGFHDGTSESSSGGSDTLIGNLNFRPTTKLSVGASGSYNDSLLGSIPEAALNGGADTVRNLGSFRSVLVEGDANYQLLKNLSLRASVNRVDQEFLGQSYGATQFNGSANYNLEHSLLKGLSFNLGVFDTAAKEGNIGLGFFGNLNFHRKFDGWDVDSTLSYAQNVETLIIVDTTSSYSYLANARRRVGNRSYFMAGYSGSHSAFTAQAGNSSSAQRVSSSLTHGRYSANGFYSTSRGTAALTATGLVALPPGLPPSALPPGAVVVFDSKAYGFNASASPLRHLTASAGYAESKGDTIDPLASVFTKNNLINGVMQYKLRKIYVNGGYTRLRQSVGTPGTVPVTVTTYYIGISRWFNFF
jgi:hypothetical protein